MAHCLTIKECKEIILKIKKRQKEVFPREYAAQEEYWCPICDSPTSDSICYCDHDD